MDLQSLKVPVFPDINDTPTPPTSTSAGNGSHLIFQYNSLVSSLQTVISNLLEQVSGNWQVVSDDRLAVPGDKIVFKTNQPISGKTTYYLDLPSNPSIGTPVTFINTNPAIAIGVRNFGGVFNGFNGILEASVQEAYVTRTLIYTGTEIGWIPTAADDYTKVFDNSVNT